MNLNRPAICGFALLLFCMPPTGQAQTIDQASPEQLQRWLKQFPAADANGDGKLTVEEAEAYRKRLHKRLDGRGDFKQEYTFATTSDDVRIALAVGYPAGFDAGNGQKWPTIFSTCGYTFATVPINPGQFGHRCVTVNASLRGTGASGGQLNPWCERTWQDGYEVIENWIVKQPWSNGRVGVIGHSWPGLMGFYTASTNPPSVKAVCVSGLFDDFYRGICRPGGVRNCGFPEDWLNSYYHVKGPFGSGEAAMDARGLSEAEYRRIVASRGLRDLRQDMLWVSLHEHLDGPVWQEKSLAERAALIKTPILLGHQYQDEQTGPSGCWLFSHIPDDTPKRIILSNGPHQPPPVLQQHIAAWFEHFLVGEGDGTVADPDKRVHYHFETRRDGPRGRVTTNPPLAASDFPIPDTQWTRLYLRAGDRLSLDPPKQDESPDRYRVDRGHPLGGNEILRYTFDIDAPTAIAGPIVATLWAKLSSVDTDFFVLLADRAPDGTLYGLQRGLLRASHRRLDEDRSVYAESDGKKVLIRPHHPHAEIEPVRPHAVHEYRIEIPPVAHVFRPGHQLVVRISRPPSADPIGVTKWVGPSYRYDSDAPPGVVQVLHDREHPSHLLLPVLPKLPPIPDEPPDPKTIYGLQRVE